MIRRFASWGYLAAAGALLIVASCGSGSDAEATTTPASVIQPAATLPPLFPIAEEVRKVEEGDANNWTDRSLLSGVTVAEATEWGRQSGFTKIVVADVEEDLPAIGGPGFTLVIRESGGIVESAWATML